jgi:hypothetical protein
VGTALHWYRARARWERRRWGGVHGRFLERTVQARQLDAASCFSGYPKLFVVGCPRSGTSWIRDILQLHPRVVSGWESHAYPSVYEALRDADPRRADAGQGLLARVRREHDAGAVGLSRYIGADPLARLLDAALARWRSEPTWTYANAAAWLVRAVFDRYFTLIGGRPQDLFVEKTPLHVRFAEEILRDFPEARLVHVLRDGRDVCVSMQMRALGADWSPADRRTQIELWRDSVERGLQVLERHPERTLGLRYEDVKADPEREIARLYGFAGVPHDRKRVARAARDSDFSRYPRTGDGLHLRKGAVGDWRNHFDPQDEALFESLAGDLARRCGYDDAPSR